MFLSFKNTALAIMMTIGYSVKCHYFPLRKLQFTKVLNKEFPDIAVIFPATDYKSKS